MLFDFCLLFIFCSYRQVSILVGKACSAAERHSWSRAKDDGEWRSREGQNTEAVSILMR